MPTIIHQKSEDSTKQKLLDHFVVPIDDYFPEKKANKLAKIEVYNKHLYRPNTYLHKWWARRCGTTFRYILKQLVEDPDKRDYYTPGGLEGKIIFDPMMGGGTTIHEAIRMGANVIGIDIDPIPVLQTKAGLFRIPLNHKKEVYNEFLNKLKNSLSSLFSCTCPKCGCVSEIKFVLYGLRRKCSCGEAIFIDTFILRHNQESYIKLCPHCGKIYENTEHICSESNNISLVKKGTKYCNKCNNTYEDIIDEPFSKRYIPLVISAYCQQHGDFFKSFNQNDLEKISNARKLVQNIDWKDEESFSITSGPKSKDLLNRGISSYIELFSPRQLLYLKTSADLLSKFSDNDRMWLALLVSTSLEFNSLLCGYKGHHLRRPGAVRHVFSHHAYSIPYTALENNPIYSGKASGTLNRLFNDRVLRAGKWAENPQETYIEGGKKRKIIIDGEIDRGEELINLNLLKNGIRCYYIQQGDSTIYDISQNFVDYIVTDPPYFDNVQYSDLSNFFRVWLNYFIPHMANWLYDSSGSAVVENGDVINSRKYCDLLTKIWKNCYKSLKKESGRLIFTFHHWNPDAWAELTISLKNTRYELINRYVVISENPSSVHVYNLKALKHDVVFVLKPISKADSGKKWTEIKKIDVTDSYSFCRDCGTALGWLLTSDFNEDNIRREWYNMLGVFGNGKTPR